LIEPPFPPTHPVTRLGRVIQQLRSFRDLHSAELESLAAELEPDAAAKIRIYGDLQRDEGQLIVDELLDVQQALKDAAQPTEPSLEAPAASPPEEAWQASPKRAQWLEEQTEARQPRSRRDFFKPLSS
jgi:hypothetical protein